MTTTASLTQEQAAALRGVTARRMRQMASEDNPPPQDGNGQYPPEEFGAWLRAGDKAADYYAERARLTKEQADKAEMENGQRRMLLADVYRIAERWAAVGVNIKTRLLAIPVKAAPLVLRCKTIAEVHEVLTKLIHEALVDISGSPPGLPAGAGVVQSDDAAADTDGKPVGRQKQKAKPRGQRRAG